MIPSFKPGILSSTKIRSAGADVTPTAVNWANISYDGLSGVFTATERQITGINQTITLKMTNPNSDGVYYYVSNTAGAIVTGDGNVSCVDPPSCGMIFLAEKGTFTVSNNQYVTFAGSGSSDLYTITITNQTDANTVLDTFTYSCNNCI